MHIHEYTRYDAVGLRNLIKSGEVTAAEVETAAREALAAADERVNGLALPSSRRPSATPRTAPSPACRS
ncbi:hypothetical protein [Thermocatellispora tengchongensis]|uniref:hypothetical protein n=1 Tax=Thermocatellispora tengchongensis TaxID=1073253 RepID=UPI0036319806